MRGWLCVLALAGCSTSEAKTPACPAGMVQIPAGTFTMGNPEGRGKADEHPQHEVKVAAFCIDRTEVTVRAFAACVEAGGCAKAKTEISEHITKPENAAKLSTLCNGDRKDRQDHPINCVDHNQAKAYCTWANKRLPGEAEWEYAAGGTDGRQYPWGNEPVGKKKFSGCGSECTRWLKREIDVDSTPLYDRDDGYEGTAPVGSFPDDKSPFGVLDMAGNVFEWTADLYKPYGSDETMASNYVGRGGGFDYDDPLWVSVRHRSHSKVTFRYSSMGFRCAK